MRHNTLAVLLLTSVPAHGQEVLTAAQLSAIIAPVRAFLPRGQFDPRPVQPSLEGKRSTYTVTPRQVGPNNRICSGFASWGYWPEKPLLEVTAGNGVILGYELLQGNEHLFELTPGGGGTPMILNSFTCAKSVTAAVARTALGTPFDVANTVETIDAIAEPGMFIRAWPSSWSAAVSGAAAKQYSQNVRVRLSGTLGDWAPGKSVKCGTQRKRGTLTLPFADLMQACLIKGHVDRIEFINSATGEILSRLEPGVQ